MKIETCDVDQFLRSFFFSRKATFNESNINQMVWTTVPQGTRTKGKMIDAVRTSTNLLRAACKSTSCYVFQKLSFGDALRSFHLATSNKNINRNFLFCKKIHSCPKPRNYITVEICAAEFIPGNPSPLHNLDREVQ